VFRSLEEFCLLLSDKIQWLSMLQDPWRLSLRHQNVPPPPPKPLHKPWFTSRHTNCAFCPSWLTQFRHWLLCLYLALGFNVGWNISTGLWSELSFLTRKVVSGVPYPYISCSKIGDIHKIDVYSYTRAHRRASCSAGVICRGCVVVTCKTQPSIY
jgi:hypothetical protein